MLAPVTFEISSELANRLRPLKTQVSRILELGLREFDATEQTGFEGAAEVLELLATLPSPEEILALRPSKPLQKRISELLEKNRTVGLNADEDREWEQFQYLEHLVRVAKARAYAKLHQA